MLSQQLFSVKNKVVYSYHSRVNKEALKKVPYFMKFSRHVYFAITKIGYFAILRKCRIQNHFYSRFYQLRNKLDYFLVLENVIRHFTRFLISRGADIFVTIRRTFPKATISSRSRFRDTSRVNSEN